MDETYSNVVKIFSVIERLPGQQLAYYDPGVGTLSYDNELIPLKRRIRKGLALATGAGMEDNVTEAYSFLMENYEDGDQIFLFGFSRGAYTVRVLAGLIHNMGILRKGCQNMITYAWDADRLSFDKKKKAAIYEFKANFSRDAQIKFLGIWDTVSSVGLLTGRTNYPNTFTNDDVLIVRHAMAIDEPRRFYRQNLFKKTSNVQDIKQVWFAGAHSDVGGSYPLNESELAQVTLEWMIREAHNKGLLFDKLKIAQVIPKFKTSTISNASYEGQIHESLSGWWWIGELWPKKNRETKKTVPPLRQPRFLFLGPSGEALRPTIHQSVINLINDPKMNYAPNNLVGHEQYRAGNYDIEV